jgi:hypothetical protein
MAIKKKVTEKATGEKYASKSAKAKHEKNESNAEMKKEYGYVKSPAKMGSTETGKKSREANKRRETNKATKSYNDAKAMLRSTDKKFDISGGRIGTARQRAARVVASMEASDPKTYKSIKGLPAPGAKATTKSVTRNSATKPAPKVEEKPAVKANSYEAANKGGTMDKLVKARNSAAKGSREYAAAQNQINAAMGSKVRHKAKDIEPVSTIKSSGVVATKEFKKPPVSTTPEAVQLPSKKGESAVTKKEKGFFGKKSAMKSVAKKIKR